MSDPLPSLAGIGGPPIVAGMSERFYINCPLSPGIASLDGEEAHHLAAVCRLRLGDPLFLFNGDGQEFPARVVKIESGQVALEVFEPARPDRELPFSLTVACPPPKGDRIQFLVEKLTELGVTRYVPLSTQRRQPHPRELRPDKLHRQVIEASKQCGRNVLMKIDALASWEDFCRRGSLAGLKMLAHPGGLPLADLQPGVPAARDIALAIGPEGGFSEEEIATARTAGWQLVDLGPRILRVETAAIVLAGVIASFRQA
ncbi:MAG: 16S rRNA (uracil(1498)-N(3))-methyltransferase [Planctomycetes bacterium]|nr:16S rRNA (uracil(1498)-N(3))-methyltransferase [Planctomycetota bacterium]